MLLNCGVGEDLRVPWTARRSNRSILKEISPEYSLVGLMPKLKLQYFGHLMQRADSLEKTLVLGNIEAKRSGWQRMRWLDSTIDSMGRNLSKLRETVKDTGSWKAAVHGFAQSWTRLSDWTVDISPFKYESKATKHFKELYRYYPAAHMKSSFILCSKHNSLEGKEHETNFLRKMVYPRQKKSP